MDAAERKRIQDNEIADRIEDLRAYLKTPTATCPWEDIDWLLDQLTHSQGRIAELEGAIAGNWLVRPEDDDFDDYCLFCKAETGIGQPHTATCIVLTLPEQQPIAGTKEGGGG